MKEEMQYVSTRDLEIMQLTTQLANSMTNDLMVTLARLASKICDPDCEDNLEDLDLPVLASYEPDEIAVVDG